MEHNYNVSLAAKVSLAMLYMAYIKYENEDFNFASDS